MLVEGEFLQREYVGRADAGEAEYERVARLKTSSLFAFAAWCGAYLPRGDADGAARFARFAERFGLAFQIVDDVLDFDHAATGKSPLADLRDGKMSLPIVLALAEEQSLRRDFERIVALDGAAATDELAALQAGVRRTSALGRCRDRARALATEALDALSDAPHSVYRSALEEACRFVGERIA